MSQSETDKIQEQVTRQYQEATDTVVRSVRALNELFTASTDMAFDMVLRNWDYSRSLRGSAEQAIADAIKNQQRFSREMLQAWTGYAGSVQEILNKDEPKQ